MGDRNNHSKAGEYLSKLTLMGIFLAGLGAFLYWRSSTGQDLDGYQIRIYDLVMLVFAVLRLGRMIAYDLITEPLRSPFTRTVPDETGAGDSVEPKGIGLQNTLGQLISCPICAGTWVSALLVSALYAWPGPTRVFITVLGVMGFVEVLNALIEGLSWSGQLGRTQAGEILKRERASQPPWNDNQSSPSETPEKTLPHEVEKR